MENDDDGFLLGSDPIASSANRFTPEQRLDRIERYLIRTHADTAQIPRLQRLIRWILNAEEGEEYAKIDQMARERGRFMTGLRDKVTSRAGFWKSFWFGAWGLVSLILGSIATAIISKMTGTHP